MTYLQTENIMKTCLMLFGKDYKYSVSDMKVFVTYLNSFVWCITHSFQLGAGLDGIIFDDLE